MLGFVLRIYDLGAESIWFDEAFSAKVVNISGLTQLEWILSGGKGYEPNPPLYFILLHLWAKVFGDSEFSLRLLSAVLGSASIFALYSFGKLLFNRRTAVIAALIIAVSVFHIQFSQEARSYSLTVLLTIISFYSLITLTTRRSLTWSALYLVSSILMIYRHYYGLFIIAAQNLFCLTLFIRDRKAGEISVKRWISLQLIMVLGCIPAAVHLFRINTSMHKSFWITEPTLERLWNYLVSYSGSVYLLCVFAVFTLISVVGNGYLYIESNIPNER